jgi:hypothetical protein
VENPPRTHNLGTIALFLNSDLLRNVSWYIDVVMIIT